MTARCVRRLAEAVAVVPRNMEGSCECTDLAVEEKRWPSSLGAAFGATNALPWTKTSMLLSVNTRSGTWTVCVKRTVQDKMDIYVDRVCRRGYWGEYLVLRADSAMRMEKNSFRVVRYQLDDKIGECEIWSSIFFPQSVFIYLCMVVITSSDYFPLQHQNVVFMTFIVFTARYEENLYNYNSGLTLSIFRVTGWLYSTDMRRLTTGIRSEKCIVRRFRRCANVVECTYTNLDSIAYCTPWLYSIAYCS